MRFLLLCAFSFSIPLLSQAQVDVSSELLLRPANAEAPNEAGLESGRYKKKKPKSLPGKRVSGTVVDSESALAKATAVVVPGTTTTTTSTSTSTVTTTTAVSSQKSLKAKSKNPELEKLLFTQTTSTTSTTVPAVKATAQKIETVDKSVESVETKSDFEEPTVLEQVRDSVMGNSQPIVEAYREQIHPDDIRLNRVEIHILPGVVSDTSKSNYSFRNYNTFSPKLSLGTHYWLSPFLGVYADYTTSMGADIEDDSSTRSRSTAQHEWTEIGFDIRKFFGMSRKSNSLQFGVHLSEYKFTVPGDDAFRAKLRSAGVGLHLLARVPVAPSYSWVFGGKLIPRVQHSELGTGLNLSSGSTGESTRVDLSVGGEFKMSRQNQIVWDVTTSFEKNQFNGQADLADPETGSKPKGVSVQNTFVLFSLGYRWGQ